MTDRIRAWIPGIVGGPVLEARSDLAAIVVSHLEVFPDGIEMPVAIYVRDPDVFEEPVTERGHDRRFVMRTAPWRLEPFARFGISFAVDLPDGTRLTVDEPYVPTPAPSKPPRNCGSGRNRSGRRVRQRRVLPNPHLSVAPPRRRNHPHHVCVDRSAHCRDGRTPRRIAHSAGGRALDLRLARRHRSSGGLTGRGARCAVGIDSTPGSKPGRCRAYRPLTTRSRRSRFVAADSRPASWVDDAA